jgi:hypothetical protein
MYYKYVVEVQNYLGLSSKVQPDESRDVDAIEKKERSDNRILLSAKSGDSNRREDENMYMNDLQHIKNKNDNGNANGGSNSVYVFRDIEGDDGEAVNDNNIEVTNIKNSSSKSQLGFNENSRVMSNRAISLNKLPDANSSTTTFVSNDEKC